MILDIGIIVLNLLLGETNTYYNLDQENNFPTYYQSIKLLVFGLYLLYKSYKDKYNSWFLWVASIIFIYISVDETLMIHEDFPEYANHLIPATAYNFRMWLEGMGYTGVIWIFYAMGLILLSSPFLIYELIYLIKNYKYNKLSSIMIFLGTLLFLAVLFVEGYATSGVLSREEYNLMVMIEEGSELVGASLLVFAFFNWKKPLKIDVMKYLK